MFRRLLPFLWLAFVSAQFGQFHDPNFDAIPESNTINEYLNFDKCADVTSKKDGSTLNIEVSIKDDKCYPKDQKLQVIAFRMTNERNDIQLKRQIREVIHQMVESDQTENGNILRKTIHPRIKSVKFENLDKSSVFRIVMVHLDNSDRDTPQFLMISRNSYGGDMKPSNLEVILIVILAILLFITFVLLGVLIYINYAGDNRLQNVFFLWSKTERRQLLRSNKGDQSYRASTLSFGSFHEQDFEIKSHPIGLSELSDTIPLMIENGVLKQEYSSVFRGQLMRWDYSKQVQHKSKNRYGNLLPYDHTRVVLEVIDGDVNSDYINANYVDGYKYPNRYVATQGPLTNTFADFWRMVWQLDSHQIVMLTSLDEGGKNKCDKYWPDKSETYSYGENKLDIKVTKTEIFADYIVRTFSLEKDGSVRQVVQYHFLSWPDHAVPMYSCSLLTFVRRMRSSMHYKPNQPIIVHCSAGVGRTGTLILIDAMLEMAKHEKQIDILKHFCVIRQQRINLVEKLSQYVFAHQALLEALSHEPTGIDCNDFEHYYNKLVNFDYNSKTLPLMSQFLVLNKLSPQVMNPELCQSAKAHPHLNRNQEIVPPDYARVILPGTDDYINAVYVNGYKRRDAYIVTQVPPESSQSQFWQMIAATATKTIVTLNDIKHDNQVFWPTMSKKQLEFKEKKLTIQLVSEENDNDMTIRVFHLPQSDLTVKQLHLKGWPSLATKPLVSPQKLIDMIEKTEQWNLTSSANSIVVQCFDGAQASGVYCALTFICDRIKEEQLVDVFLAVQTIRTNRPQFITDLDQYKYLHQLAISYLQHFDTYANFK